MVDEQLPRVEEKLLELALLCGVSLAFMAGRVALLFAQARDVLLDVGFGERVAMALMTLWRIFCLIDTDSWESF